MSEEKKTEILRIDLRLKGKDKEEFLFNMKLLDYRKYPDYLRDLINNKPIYANLLRHWFNEFRKQGNNINQIARNINTEKSISNQDREQLDRIEKNQLLILEGIKKYATKKF
jgi:hypothetical protein